MLSSSREKIKKISEDCVKLFRDKEYNVNKSRKKYDLNREKNNNTYNSIIIFFFLFFLFLVVFNTPEKKRKIS